VAAVVRIRRVALARITQSPSGPVFRHIDTLGRRTANAAKRRAPVDEGVLRASIGHHTRAEPGQVVSRVSCDVFYAIYQLLGTGIYGPRRRIITPKTKRFLRFEVKKMGPLQAGERNPARGNRNIVFARFVRGTPKNPFLQDALREVSPYPVDEHFR
jgi:hypothetical protein